MAPALLAESLAGWPGKTVSDPPPISITRIRVPAGYGTGRTLLRQIPRFWWRALHELRRLQPAVVHAQDLDTLPLAYLYGRWAGVPVIFDAREYYPGMVRDHVGAGIAGALDRLERVLVPRTDAVIAVGERLAAHYRALGGQVSIVDNSAPLPDLNRVDREGQAVRRSWGVPDGALLVVYVGMLNADRLLMPLIEAARELDQVWVVIGGTGTEEPKLRAAGAGCERIRFLGWVPPGDVWTIVAAGDVVYYGRDARNPNTPYFMSNLTSLALSAGRPLLLTPTGEIAEVVRRAGCGVVMESATGDSVRRALKNLSNPSFRVTLGHRARFICQEEYHWCKSADQLLTLYRGI